MRPSWSSAPEGTLKSIRFRVWSAKGIQAMSSAEITSADHHGDGPKAGTLKDPRLGVTKGTGRDAVCATCEFGHEICVGHWGHVPLAKPVYHLGFISVVTHVLMCICHACSTLRVDTRPNPPEGVDPLLVKLQEALRGAPRGTDRLRAVSKVCRTREMCRNPECRTLLPYSVRVVDRGQKGLELHIRPPRERGGEDADRPPATKTPFSAEEAVRALEKVSREDAVLMGFTPPPDVWGESGTGFLADLVIRNLPIPPPHVRPSVNFGGNTSEEDLSVIFSGVLRLNARVAKTMHARQSSADELTRVVNLLQYHIGAVFDNERAIPPVLAKGRLLKGIRERLRGKQGRLRMHLMGKRVNFSARTVITADPFLELDQVGVPRSVAMTLTVPERVTSRNMAELTRAIQNGPDVWPGAHAYTDATGTRFRLARAAALPELAERYVVERHLRDDDVVLFNRQPTLHRMSMMGHRVRVLPYSTFRLNLSVTTPYNADFDGDEMNLHCPQSEATIAELKSMMMVPRNILTAQASRPCMGIVQDSCVGSYVMTSRSTFVDVGRFFTVAMAIPDCTIPVPAILHPRVFFTGKQLASLAFSAVGRPGTTTERVSKTTPDAGSFPTRGKPDPWLCEKDDELVLLNGVLMSGRLSKKRLGATAGGLLHDVCLDYGPYMCAKLISCIQRVVGAFLLQHGFSVGISDCVANQDTLDQVRDIVEKGRGDVRKVTEDAQRGKLEQLIGRTKFGSFEFTVNKELNSARDRAGKTASDSLPPTNNFVAMVTSGSKGSDVNISSILALVGQQNVEDKRIPFGFYRRTLPCFVQDDYGPESRGFVVNSYLRGLTPQEFFFHAMGGRVGLTDTAVKTSLTGYLQRRFIKAMEDLVVRYDGTVRDARDRVVQFVYGEDGLDGSRLEQQTLVTERFSDSKFRDTFEHACDPANPSVPAATFGTGYIEPTVRQSIVGAAAQADSTWQLLREEWRQLSDDRSRLRSGEVARLAATTVEQKGQYFVPVNIARLVVHTQLRFGGSGAPLNPRYVVEKVRAFCNQIVAFGVRPPGPDASFGVVEQYRRAKASVALFEMYVRASLASKRVLREYRLDKSGFDFVMSEMESRLRQAYVAPGEAVGVVCAQSLGEPATQMTLNTFHHAGVSAKNVTLGVPRLLEILNLAKMPKTPQLTLFLRPAFSHLRPKSGGVPVSEEVASAWPARVKSALEGCVLRNLVQHAEIVFDPIVIPTEDTVDSSPLKEDARILLGDYDRDTFEPADWEKEVEMASRASPWVIRLHLPQAGLLALRLDGPELKEAIRKAASSRELLIHTVDIEPMRYLRIRCLDDNFAAVRNRMAQRHDGDPLDGDDADGAGPTDSPCWSPLFHQQLLKELLNVPLRGLPEIKRVFLREEDKLPYLNHATGEWVTGTTWVCETDGVDLKAIVAQPVVDATQAMSNHIHEVFELLGIEATRQLLYRELSSVYKGYGILVNFRHYALLCDAMTQRGTLMAISRHGINRNEVGPLMRCSNEQTVEVLADAAVFSELDDLRGVSGAIVFGKVAPVGTGVVHLLADRDALRAVMPPTAEWQAQTALHKRAWDASRELMMGTPGTQAPLDTPAVTPGPSGLDPMTPFAGSGVLPDFSPADQPAHSYVPASGVMHSAIDAAMSAVPQSPLAGHAMPYSAVSAYGAFSSAPLSGSRLPPESPMAGGIGGHFADPTVAQIRARTAAAAPFSSLVARPLGGGAAAPLSAKYSPITAVAGGGAVLGARAPAAAAGGGVYSPMSAVPPGGIGARAAAAEYSPASAMPPRGGDQAYSP